VAIGCRAPDDQRRSKISRLPMTIDRSRTSADLPNFVASPSSAPVKRVRDVIVCPTNQATDQPTLEELTAHAPIEFSMPAAGIVGESVSIAEGTTIGRLDNAECARVMNACSPRGHHFVPIRQFGQRYSFIREIEPESVRTAPIHWDSDDVLYDCLALSRLVRDNAYSLQYAARILDFEDGQQQIIPAVPSSAAPVFRLRTDRDWLDSADAAELSGLIAVYREVRDVLPDRVRRAMWRAEWSCSLAWADVALAMIVSGLEALLKTDPRRATRQFVRRGPLLARALGIGELTAELCCAAYDGRSAWVHGAPVELFNTAGSRRGGALEPSQATVLSEVSRFQDLLRRAVRRAIHEPAFRAVFVSDESVRTCWPLS
jgi:hypothetical protein